MDEIVYVLIFYNIIFACIRLIIFCIYYLPLLIKKLLPGNCNIIDLYIYIYGFKN